MLRLDKRTFANIVAIIVAITMVASSVATYFFVIYIPSTAITPCVTTGHTHCFTIVANLNGYNGSVHQPPPIMTVQKGDTVVLRLINNDSVQPHGLAVQFYTPNGIVARLGETKSISFQATTTGKFQIYEPISTTIYVYEKAELDVN
jgi:hypothetical protein